MTPQNRRGSGRFVPGVSGNPGGRPVGLARAAREAAGEDGQVLAEFWIEVMRDRSARMADRLRASEYLADRAFGKAMGALPSDDQAPASPPEIYRMPTHKRLVALVRLAAELEPGIFDGVDHRVDAETAGGSLARTTRPTP